MRWFWKTRRSMQDDLSEEMESHLLEKAEALEADGMSPREALAAARRSFGNQAMLRDRGAEVWENRFLSAVSADFRFAFAQLKRAPVYVCAAILILSMGIGANTAIFAVLYQATLRKLPVQEPEALVFVTMVGPKTAGHEVRPSYPLLRALAAEQTDMEAVSGWVHDRVMIADEEDHQRSASAMLVTGNAFDVLGVHAAAGRLLQVQDDGPRGKDVWPVVLSDRFWNAKYHRNPAAIGERVTISGRVAEIVGVAPPGFEGITPNVPVQMYLPIDFLAAQNDAGVDRPLEKSDFFWITSVGRLRGGVSLRDANAHLRASTAVLVQRFLQPYLKKDPMLADMHLQMTSASRGIQTLNDYSSTLKLLQVLMASALVFCCVNVAGLQLARTLERTHEFALRVALGANRIHLMRQCLTEALLVAAGGASLALPVTFAGTRLFSDFLTKPGAGEIVVVRPDWPMFAIAGVFTVVCTMTVGLLPVLSAHGADPAAVLKAKSSMRRQPAIASRALLAAQIAVTFLLLTTANFYWRTLHRIYGQDLGYNPVHVTEVAAQFQQMRKTPDEIMDIYRRMLHQLNAHKDIEAATVTWITQLTGVDPKLNVSLPGSQSVHEISFNQVGPRYFETLQTKLLAGREFTDQDTDTGHCIVNELAAKQLFGVGAHEAMGRRMHLSYFSEMDTQCEVVGVVQAAKYADIHAPQTPIVFVPITASSLQRGAFNVNMVFLIRSEHEAEANAAYREILEGAAPGTGYQRFLPMTRQMSDALGPERLLTSMTVFFSGAALLLCGAATLSLLLMRVKQSIPEIAIRVALGATPLHAAGMVLRETALLVVVGTAAGGFSLRGVEYVTTRYLHFTHSIALADIFGAVVLIVVMSMSAGGIPAIRAARLQPMQVLCRDS